MSPVLARRSWSCLLSARRPCCFGGLRVAPSTRVRRMIVRARTIASLRGALMRASAPRCLANPRMNFAVVGTPRASSPGRSYVALCLRRTVAPPARAQSSRVGLRTQRARYSAQHQPMLTVCSSFVGRRASPTETERRSTSLRALRERDCQAIPPCCNRAIAKGSWRN